MKGTNRSDKSYEKIGKNAETIRRLIKTGVSLEYGSAISSLLKDCGANKVDVLFDEDGFYQDKDNNSFLFSGMGNENKLVFEIRVALDPEVPNE